MGQTVLEQADVLEWAEGLRHCTSVSGGGFGRREPRQRALAYLKGLLGSVERKNGWSPQAEPNMLATPRPTGAATAGHLSLGC